MQNNENNETKQWKYCWILDLFIIFVFFDSENLRFVHIFKKKKWQVLIFDIIRFRNFETSGAY